MGGSSRKTRKSADGVVRAPESAPDGTPLIHHGQAQPVMTSVSSVTAPLRASALPSRFTPVVIVIEVRARMFPLNIENVPSVAELPTCQKILQALALLARMMWLPLAVVSVDA